MSDDPETARQIAELSRDTRPLLVLDVDEVLLEFIGPFIGFLGSRGAEVRHAARFACTATSPRPRRARWSRTTASPRCSTDFFGLQADWQVAADGAAEAIAWLAANAEIVMLTAMPHKHRAVRRAHLDALGFPYPLLTTETAEGPGDPAVARRPSAPGRLRRRHRAQSRSRCATRSRDAHLFHLMAHAEMRRLMPPLPDGIVAVESWTDAAPKIAGALGI